MMTWEFLLQQEGDEEWLPLESPVVEILEGRYRLVASSRYSNTPIWVDVVFRDEAFEFSPLDNVHSYVQQTERMQAWESQTNAEGLLLIMPFSYLKPGEWEFKCQVDTDCPASEALSQVDASQICLQVLATESNVKDPWSHLDLFSTEEEVQAPPIPVITATTVPAETTSHRMTDHPPAPVPTTFYPTPQSIPQSTPTNLPGPIPTAAPITADLEPATAQDFRYYFNIVQEHLAVHRCGESVWLLGEIQVEASTGSAITELPFPVVLQVILREPTTRQPIQEFLHPIGHDLIPIPFACELSIPETYHPHLLLGELTLCRVNVTQGDNIQDDHIQGKVIAIASQPFSVVTNLDTVFTRPSITGENAMTRLFHTTELLPISASLKLDHTMPVSPAAFPVFSPLQHSGWDDFVALASQDTIPVPSEPIDALAPDDLDTLDDLLELEIPPVVVNAFPSFQIKTQVTPTPTAATNAPTSSDPAMATEPSPTQPMSAIRTGELCLDLFNLVKHSSYRSPNTVESAFAPTQWMSPAQVFQPEPYSKADTPDVDSSDSPLPKTASPIPLPKTASPQSIGAEPLPAAQHRASQFLDLPLHHTHPPKDPAAVWAGTLHTPMFNGHNSVRDLSQRPVSSAQVLTRLIHATQTDVPTPTPQTTGGQAAIQNRFHSKLADLLSVKPTPKP